MKKASTSIKWLLVSLALLASTQCMGSEAKAEREARSKCRAYRNDGTMNFQFCMSHYLSEQAGEYKARYQKQSSK